MPILNKNWVSELLKSKKDYQDWTTENGRMVYYNNEKGIII